MNDEPTNRELLHQLIDELPPEALPEMIEVLNDALEAYEYAPEPPKPPKIGRVKARKGKHIQGRREFRFDEDLELSVQEIRQIIRGYEQRFGMTSDEFLQRWLTEIPFPGELWEHNHWAMLLRYHDPENRERSED